jgi:hypothetical protein
MKRLASRVGNFTPPDEQDVCPIEIGRGSKTDEACVRGFTIECRLLGQRVGANLSNSLAILDEKRPFAGHPGQIRYSGQPRCNQARVIEASSRAARLSGRRTADANLDKERNRRGALQSTGNGSDLEGMLSGRHIWQQARALISGARARVVTTYVRHR